MQVQLVNVVCDTSFLIHLATRKIKNIENLDTEIGEIQFVVPDVVKKELDKLTKNVSKKEDAVTTQNYIKDLPKIEILGNYADESIINYVKKNGGIIATLDTTLKDNVKKFGGSIMSLSNNRIVLES